MLVGTMLVGGLGVALPKGARADDHRGRVLINIYIYIYICTHMYITRWGLCPEHRGLANLRAKILDFRWLYSSIIWILRGGILMLIGNLPESLSQGILVGIILVGRLGVDVRGLFWLCVCVCVCACLLPLLLPSHFHPSQ